MHAGVKSKYFGWLEQDDDWDLLLLVLMHIVDFSHPVLRQASIKGRVPVFVCKTIRDLKPGNFHTRSPTESDAVVGPDFFLVEATLGLAGVQLAVPQTYASRVSAHGSKPSC